MKTAIEMFMNTEPETKFMKTLSSSTTTIPENRHAPAPTKIRNLISQRRNQSSFLRAAAAILHPFLDRRRAGWLMRVALTALLGLTLWPKNGNAVVIPGCLGEFGVWYYFWSGTDMTNSGLCIWPDDVSPACASSDGAGGTSGSKNGGFGLPPGLMAGGETPPGSGAGDDGASGDETCCGNESGPGADGGLGAGGCGSAACQSMSAGDMPGGFAPAWKNGSGFSPAPPTHNGGGMPVWRVSEPRINLWLRDKPLFYQTSRGFEVGLRLIYKEVTGAYGIKDTAQAAFFGVGTNWHTPWRSYISQTNGVNVMIFLGDGGARFYPVTTSTATNLEFYSHGRLYNDSSNRLCLDLTSGKTLIYNDTNTVAGVTNIFLSQVREAAGHPTQFTYTNSNNSFRLAQITDPDGNQTTFSYTNTSYYSNLIAQVNGPHGLTSVLTYNTNGQLIKIRDVMNLESQMSYDSGNRLSTLVTPYGTNNFDYYYSTGTTNWQALRVTELGLRQTLYLEGATNANILPSAASEYASLSQFVTNAGLSETFEDAKYSERNTLLWAPRQYANLPSSIRTSLDNGTFDPINLTTNDFQKGRLRHWLRAPATAMSSPTLSLERNASPKSDGSTEGLLTWYDYAYKSDRYSQGSSLPLSVAARLPGGPWRIAINERNSLGKPTTQKETYTDASGTTKWRTNTFEYAANKMDLVRLTVISETVSNIYNAFHQVVTNYNALNEVTTYAFNANQQLTNRSKANGLITDFFLDSNNWPTSVVDRADAGVYYRTNSYTYTNGLVQTHTDPRGLTVTITWDALARLVTTAFPDGTTTSRYYTNLDLSSVVDRMGFTNRFERNGFGQVLRAIDARGFTNTYQYCDCGSLDSTTDPLGNTTSFSYDNLGRRTRVTYPGNSGNIYVDYSFDLLGQTTNVTESTGVSTTNYFTVNGLIYTASNSAGRVFLKLFDDHDRVIWQVDRNGSKSYMIYDALGRLLTRTNFYAYADWPDFDDFSYFSWDNLYYSPGITAPTGRDGTLAVEDFGPAGHNDYAYDAFGRKTNDIRFDTLGGSPLLTNRFTYSGAGDLLTLTDGKGQTTTWKYDEYGHVTNKLDANGAEMFRYRYDADGRLTNRWTPAKTNTFYTWDAAGNLTKITYPVSSNITMKYDADNRLTNMVDAVGTTAYSYTGFGAVLSEDGPWANDTVTYSFDNGRRRSGLNVQAPNAPDWVQSYGYDSANRLSSVSSPVGAFNYVYHAGLDSTPSPSPLVAKISLPNGAYITNRFDDWGRLVHTALENSGHSVLNSHDYLYTALNQRYWQGRTDGSAVNYGYDALEQLSSASGFDPGGTNRVNEQFSYNYDLAGNLTSRVQNKFTNFFTVNNLNQLSNSTRSGTLTVAGTTTSAATNVTVNTSNAILYSDYTFARTNMSLVDGSNIFTAIAKDGLGRVDTNIVTAYLPTNVVFQYDANGNLTNDGLRSFVFNDENELTSVSVAGSFKSEFTYDGKMRRRIRREYAWQDAWRMTNEVHYVYDGNVVIQERDALNLPTIGYTRGRDLSGSMQGAGGIGGLLAFSDLKSSSISSPSHYFYHADGNGNVTMLINSGQAAVAKYAYDPFGQILACAGTVASRNPCQFSSAEFHEPSGLVLYHYRVYDTVHQRWLSREPLGDAASLSIFVDRPNNRYSRGKYASEAWNGENLYTFVRNSPTVFIDTDGRVIPLIIGGGVALTTAEAVAAAFGVTLAACLVSPPCMKAVAAALSDAVTSCFKSNKGNKRCKYECPSGAIVIWEGPDDGKGCPGTSDIDGEICALVPEKH